MEEESKKDQEKNKKIRSKLTSSSITSKKKSAPEDKLKDGCGCGDIIKFVLCGFVCCKKPPYDKNLAKEDNLASSPNLQDINKNQFEIAQEEVALESNEKTKLLSDIDNLTEENKVVTPSSVNKENSFKKIEEESLRSKSKSSNIDFNCKIKEEGNSNSESSEIIRKSPEGSERRHSKGLDAETQAPTPKRVFKYKTEGHQQQLEKGEMVATAIGTNNFYTLVSEVGL